MPGCTPPGMSRCRCTPDTFVKRRWGGTQPGLSAPRGVTVRKPSGWELRIHRIRHFLCVVEDAESAPHVGDGVLVLGIELKPQETFVQSSIVLQFPDIDLL